MSKNILVCTVGGSWAVVPEVYAFLAPDRLQLYRHHPRADELDEARRRDQLAAPHEIWIGSTCGEQIFRSLEQLRRWQHLLAQKPIIRVWLAQGADQLATAEECRHVQELLLRMCLLASEYADGGQIVLSLAGGRKTMSADLQWAGQLLGCHALVHVVGQDPLPDALSAAAPQTFAHPLPAALCPYLVPLVIARGQRSELLDLRLERIGEISSDCFPLPLASEDGALVWPNPQDDRLSDELRSREKLGSQLLGNYLASLAEQESHENWRSLYRLPARIIERLRKTTIGPDLVHLLRKLPKADLHRHVGGCLDIPAQRRVGRVVWENLSQDEQADAIAAVRSFLEQMDWGPNWPKQLGTGQERAARAAAILTRVDTTTLERNLYCATEPRIALKQQHPLGFAAYERPGDLSGSTLLRHAAAIEPYGEEIVRQATQESLSYLELRGSPHKYGDGLEFLRKFRAALHRAFVASDQKIRFRFILIVDRRQREHVSDVVKLAVAGKQEMGDFIAGIDLAGDESESSPSCLARHFLPAFEACLPVTIHAGEGEQADSIWQAAYHLHADRIGHGLTISGHETLANRFCDRRICLELCPTSNREVVGYRDPEIPESATYPQYPVMKMWRMGLPLTICTDNPGISRTTLVDEYLAASRMEPDGLSCWDALAMLKQAFVHSFAPSRERARMLKDCDSQVYQLILEHFTV